jgi:DNA-binding transcriptional regulator YhcF (GntR family)
MAKTHAGTEHAVERASRIFTVLKQAADNGLECPTNKALAERFGVRSNTISNALHLLESTAMIEIERGPGWRVVTIRATGKKTRR